MESESIIGRTSNHLHRKVLPLFLFLGAAVWVLDSLIDYFFFYQGQYSFLDLFITDIPAHELYIRSCVLIMFAGFGLVLSHYLKKHRESEIALNNIFNNVIPICITDNDFNIINANRSYRRIFGATEKNGVAIKCYDSRPGPKCETTECPHHQIIHEGKPFFTCESTKEEKDGTRQYFVVTATPYLDMNNRQAGIIETFQDITARRQLEEQREELIEKLQLAMDKVRTLSGFLPICASCKKIRDDKGYWNQIESYIREHSEAEFSHSICPECAEKLYGDYFKKDEPAKKD
ncbi:MAG: PAS domain-containing protein [Desulfobulbaceae bacterium]|nr:PAS domain-containing protein [Desulfobulbaceae bacterium]